LSIRVQRVDRSICTIPISPTNFRMLSRSQFVLTPSYLPYFDKLASTLSITTFYLSGVCLWVDYDNVILHHLPFFRRSLTYWLKLRKTPRTSVQMYSCITSSMNNYRKVRVLSSVIYESKRTFKSNLMNDMLL
jgi:hypothetical protein